MFPKQISGTSERESRCEVKKKKAFLATDKSGELHLFVGTVAPVKNKGGVFIGVTEATEYGGEVYPENIDGPIPAPGTFVECRLTVTKAGDEVSEASYFWPGPDDLGVYDLVHDSGAVWREAMWTGEKWVAKGPPGGAIEP